MQHKQRDPKHKGSLAAVQEYQPIFTFETGCQVKLSLTMHIFCNFHKRTLNSIRATLMLLRWQVHLYSKSLCKSFIIFVTADIVNILTWAYAKAHVIWFYCVLVSFLGL